MADDDDADRVMAEIARMREQVEELWDHTDEVLDAMTLDEKMALLGILRQVYERKQREGGGQTPLN